MLADPTRRGALYVIAAASGTGKTSLVKALLAAVPSLRFSVSHTTRKPRANEVNGRDYYFVDGATFNAMVARGEFLEHARVFDHQYGTSRAEVEKALADCRVRAPRLPPARQRPSPWCLDPGSSMPGRRCSLLTA